MKRFFIVLVIIVGFISNSNAQFGISAYGAAVIPTGNFNDFYNAAFGFRGNLFYSTDENSSYFLQSGYNVWKFDNNKFNNWFKQTGGIGIFEFEIPITAIPLLVGKRLGLDFSSNSKVFLEAAVGVYLIKTESSGKFTDNIGTYNIGNEKKNYTEFTIHFGGGTTMALSSNLSLDAVAFLDFITNSEAAKQARTNTAKEYYQGNQVTTFVFCIGLNYKL
jgi:opacity protein-like surface antigen